LNEAAALAEARDVDAALALVELLELDHYERALELVHCEAERRFLEERALAELTG
jgi:hypothetical protein